MKLMKLLAAAGLRLHAAAPYPEPRLGFPVLTLTPPGSPKIAPRCGLGAIRSDATSAAVSASAARSLEASKNHRIRNYISAA
ncbi:hypothetical protein BJG92_03414 [Arthrobacter sp. SO5]|nr:hypothetical protein [Arthrobacter sp. SO5]